MWTKSRDQRVSCRIHTQKYGPLDAVNKTLFLFIILSPIWFALCRDSCVLFFFFLHRRPLLFCCKKTAIDVAGTVAAAAVHLAGVVTLIACNSCVFPDIVAAVGWLVGCLLAYPWCGSQPTGRNICWRLLPFAMVAGWLPGWLSWTVCSTHGLHDTSLEFISFLCLKINDIESTTSRSHVFWNVLHFF